MIVWRLEDFCDGLLNRFEWILAIFAAVVALKIGINAVIDNTEEDFGCCLYPKFHPIVVHCMD